MRILVGILLLFGAYLCFAAAVPAPHWWVRISWPFVSGIRPFVPLRLPIAEALKNSLAMLGGFGFVFATLALFNFFIPRHWWAGLALEAIVCSGFLYFIYLNKYAVLPFSINAFLLWVILGSGWA